MMSRFARAPRAWTWGLLFLWTALVGALAGTNGLDVTPYYIGAQLMAQGKADALYQEHMGHLQDLPDPAWQALARDIAATDTTAYVHLPLFAGLWVPFAGHLDFAWVKRLSVILNACALSGMILLIARHWAPALQNPAVMAMALLLLTWFEPARAAIFLAQTTPVLSFLILAALCLERGGKPVLAGLVMALPIALKVFPALFLGFWWLKGSVKSVAASLIGVGAVVALSIALYGVGLHVKFLHVLQWFSGHTILAYGNQSLVGFLARWESAVFDAKLLNDWNFFPIAPWIAVAQASALAMAAQGMFLVRLRYRHHGQRFWDAAMALSFAVIPMLTQVSWDHYYVFLIPAFAVAIHLLGPRVRQPGLLGVLALAYALNFRVPFASAFQWRRLHVALASAQFYAALILVGVLLHALPRPQGGAGRAEL